MKPFFVSKLLIWRQKWVADVLHGNSLVARRLSSGETVVVLFWIKYAVPRQIQPLFFLPVKEKVIIVLFRQDS